MFSQFCTNRNFVEARGPIPIPTCWFSGVFRPRSLSSNQRTLGNVPVRFHSWRMEGPFPDRNRRGNNGHLRFAKARKAQLLQHHAQKTVEQSVVGCLPELREVRTFLFSAPLCLRRHQTCKVVFNVANVQRSATRWPQFRGQVIGPGGASRLVLPTPTSCFSSWEMGDGKGLRSDPRGS